jgi:hypothetical protein
MVRLHLIPYHGLSPHRLFHSRFLDEHEALHHVSQAKSIVVSISFKHAFPDLYQLAQQIFKQLEPKHIRPVTFCYCGIRMRFDK